MEWSESQKNLLQVASKIFFEKGFHGAKMQEIADQAGLNKAMLHYYFKSKQQLFDAVFEQAIQTLFPALKRLFEAPIPLKEKVSLFVDEYTELLTNHAHIPIFILSELRMNPQKVEEMAQGKPFQVEILFQQIQTEIEAGKIPSIDPPQFVLHLLSMCVFPFISGPIWKGFFSMNDAQQQDFFKKRKQSILDFFFQNL